MRRMRSMVVAAVVVTTALAGCGRSQEETATSDVDSVAGNYVVAGGGYYGYQDWGGWGRAVTAYGDYLRFIGRARLETAQAAYVWAQTRAMHARAYALERFIHSLEVDLWRLERQDNARLRFMDKVAAKAKDLDGLITGRVTPRALTAVLFFLQVPGLDLSAIAQKQVPKLGVDQFSLRSPTRTVYDPATRQTRNVENKLEEFPGGSILAYVDFLRSHSMNMKLGTAAHQSMIDLRQELTKAGENWFAAIAAQREQALQNKLDIWNSYNSEYGSLPGRQMPQ